MAAHLTRSRRSASPTKTDTEDLQQQVSQQRRTLETFKAENKALKSEIEARTKVSLNSWQYVIRRCSAPRIALTVCPILQQEQYVPTIFQQEQLGQLTDLLDVFKRKVEYFLTHNLQLPQTLLTQIAVRLPKRSSNLQLYVQTSGNANKR